MEKFILLQEQMKSFINNELSGHEIVKSIDDFVSNDYAHGITEELYRKILDLQDCVAFYVSDPDIRKEHKSYFGDEKLRTLILKFLNLSSN